MSEISIRHIDKSYDGKNKVLDDISLEIEKGDIYGILGLSGAGKSTLIRCINGLENIDDGAIYFNDELIIDKTKHICPSTRRNIAMIFQSFNLLEQKTVLENVEFALEIVHDKAKREKALKALARVSLSDKIKAYPSQLSGGEKQRVAIARALVMKPQVLLSDEATSALDPETTASILELLKELNQELGLTIIMISHQINVIESVCNKVAIIEKAKIIESGDLAEVFLSPKEELSKKLIYSNHVETSLDDKKMIRLLFDGNIDEPLIANIVQDCGILVSIIYADSKVIDGRVYGQVVIKLPKAEKDHHKLIKYLALHKVRYEEVNQ